jgi:phage I-like protein
MTELVLSDSEGERVPPVSVPLLKFGRTTFTKGMEDGEYEVTEKDADAVLADFAKRGKDLVIDFEHQTLSGQIAPAAGWIERIEKTAEGIVGKVKYWTDQAKEHLKSGGYRYYSPVIQFSRTGKSISGIHSVALTNHPATHHIPALVADDTAGEEGSDTNDNNNNNKGTMSMWTKLMALLGIAVAFSDKPEDVQEKAVEEEIGKLIDGKKGVETFLKLHDCDSLDKVTGKIQGMVPADEKNRLEAEIRKRDAEKAVELALSDGKINKDDEKFRKWAYDFAVKDLAAFTDWAKLAPVIRASVPSGKPDPSLASPQDGALSLSDDESKVFKNMGLTAEQIEKIKNQKKK